MKIVINTCFGGFCLSDKAMHLYAKRKGLALYAEDEGLCTMYFTVPPEERVKPLHGKWMDHPSHVRAEYNRLYSEQTLSQFDFKRDDPDLVAVVEELRSDADGRHARLKVVEIPDGVEWELDEYDGVEHVAEKHRTWA
jgi:hypothetical protein